MCKKVFQNLAQYHFTQIPFKPLQQTRLSGLWKHGSEPPGLQPSPKLCRTQRLMTGVMERERLARAAPLSLGREVSPLAGSYAPEKLTAWLQDPNGRERSELYQETCYSVVKEPRGLSQITKQDCVKSSGSVILNPHHPLCASTESTLSSRKQCRSFTRLLSTLKYLEDCVTHSKGYIVLATPLFALDSLVFTIQVLWLPY